MAKGDSPATANGPNQGPKMDQYSVMHAIMSRLGGQGGSMAPSPKFGGGGSMGAPMQGGGGMTPMGQGSSSVFPSMQGANLGQYANDFTPQGMTSSIGPQQTFRRQMMGNNVS